MGTSGLCQPACNHPKPRRGDASSPGSCDDRCEVGARPTLGSRRPGCESLRHGAQSQLEDHRRRTAKENQHHNPARLQHATWFGPTRWLQHATWRCKALRQGIRQTRRWLRLCCLCQHAGFCWTPRQCHLCVQRHISSFKESGRRCKGRDRCIGGCRSAERQSGTYANRCELWQRRQQRKQEQLQHRRRARSRGSPLSRPPGGQVPC